MCSVTSYSATPWTVAARLLCPWDLLGKNTGVGLLFPTPGDLPDPGIKPACPAFPALSGGFFTTGPPRGGNIRMGEPSPLVCPFP